LVYFQSKTLASGTTTATYFATIHYESSLFLADIVEGLGQRAFIGKVNMNHGTPEGYGEHTHDSFHCTEQYIRNIQSKRVINVQFLILNRAHGSVVG
jgi:guanine deaminase